MAALSPLEVAGVLPARDNHVDRSAVICEQRRVRAIATAIQLPFAARCSSAMSSFFIWNFDMPIAGARRAPRR
ncbi:MAG: hypothetical protein AB7T06_33340 [Kofleriaceae bacterium]